ncbi:MAG: hypothetical protein ACREGR_03580 [Minisyncoccia bacterium]
MNDTVVPSYPAVIVARLINLIVGLAEILFLIRIMLELLTANTASPFVAWVYQFSDRLMGPLLGAFPSLALGSGSIFDLTALLAMIVYAIVGWIIVRILFLLVP